MTGAAELGERGKRTRERLVVSGFSLSIKNGVANVSLDDILRYSEVKKGAFYYYFDTKEKFIQACFEECYLKPVSDAFAEFEKNEANSTADILHFFTTFTSKVKEKMDARLGVHAVELEDVFSNIAYMSRQDNFMAGHFREFHEKQRAFVEGCLVRMRERGEVADGVDCAEMASMMCCCREGALTMSSRGMDLDFAAVMAGFMRHFDQLLAGPR